MALINRVSIQLALPVSDRGSSPESRRPTSFVPSLGRTCLLEPKRNQRGFRCAVITGGSRRDVDRIIAKIQHRRPRHKKGMTPTKSELLKELLEEEKAEEEISSMMNTFDNKSNSTSYERSLEESHQNLSDKEEEPAAPLRNNLNDMGADRDSLSMSSASDSIDFSSSQVPDRNGTFLSDTEVGGAVSRLSEIAEEAASDVAENGKETQEKMVNNTSAGVQDLAQAADDVFGTQVGEATSTVDESISEVRDSPSVIGSVASEDTLLKAESAGQQVAQNLGEVVSTGQSALEAGNEVTGEQIVETFSQATKVAEKEGEVLMQGFSRLRSEATNLLDGVQEPLQKAVQKSTQMAESIRDETFVFSGVLFDTVPQTVQPNLDDSNSNNGSGQDPPSQSKSTSQARNLEEQQGVKSPFTEFKVLLAGATGRTGRLIAENLVKKGASVRALVRDVYKAQSIGELESCQVVEADLYKYETLKKAIADCNVVICAIGARAFPLDPFSTYQVEYEGVLNLIAAAKNQGNIKKFVLISTIGVTYFQLVPLLFWKKQAELYLQRSGLDYTIVRPGGLQDSKKLEQIVMLSADTQIFGAISRRTVAEICVSSLIIPDASEKIVEVIAVSDGKTRSIEELFKLV